MNYKFQTNMLRLVLSLLFLNNANGYARWCSGLKMHCHKTVSGKLLPVVNNEN